MRKYILSHIYVILHKISKIPAVQNNEKNSFIVTLVHRKLCRLEQTSQILSQSECLKSVIISKPEMDYSSPVSDFIKKCSVSSFLMLAANCTQQKNPKSHHHPSMGHNTQNQNLSFKKNLLTIFIQIIHQ